MEEGETLKRSWAQSNTHHEPLHQALRRQSLPVFSSATVLPEDARPYLTSGGPRLPPIATALDTRDTYAAQDATGLWDASYSLASRSWSPPMETPNKRLRLAQDKQVQIGSRDDRLTSGSYTGRQEENYDESGGSACKSLVRPFGSSDGLCRGRCGYIASHVEDLVVGLLSLERNLRQALATPQPEDRGVQDSLEVQRRASEINTRGLESSVEWSLSSLHATIYMSQHLLRRASASPSNLVASSMRPSHPGPSGGLGALPETPESRSSAPEHSQHPSEQSDIAPALLFAKRLPRLSDQSSPMSDESPPMDPSLGGRPPRSSYLSPHHVPQSPQQNMSSSMASILLHPGPHPPPPPGSYVPPSSRMLPSPSSRQQSTPPASSTLFPSLGPPSSPSQQISPASRDTAQASYFQDLQHEISKKSLALTTLQREHDTLLSAYARQQSRCAMLDKKSQVSENEINMLIEEKIQLQSQVGELELQTDDLVRTKEELQKQSVANGAQYMQIMAMSSKLQAKGAEEARQFKLERDQWDEEKRELNQELESLRQNGPTSLSRAGDNEAVEVMTTTTLDRIDTLQVENASLRETVISLQNKVHGLTQEAEEIDRMMSNVLRVRSRGSDKAQSSVAASEVGGGVFNS